MLLNLGIVLNELCGDEQWNYHDHINEKVPVSEQLDIGKHKHNEKQGGKTRNKAPSSSSACSSPLKQVVWRGSSL